jgi:hypothetical protein
MTEREQILNILNLLVKPKFDEIIEFEIGEKLSYDRLGEKSVYQLKVVVEGTDYEQEIDIEDEIISVLKYINLQNKVVISHIVE